MNCGLFHSNIHSHSPPLWTRFSGVGGGGGLRKSFPRGLTGTFDLWNISEGCKKNWLFLWGGGRRSKCSKRSRRSKCSRCSKCSKRSSRSKCSKRSRRSKCSKRRVASVAGVASVARVG